jgi:hypothetical protein
MVRFARLPRAAAALLLVTALAAPAAAEERPAEPTAPVPLRPPVALQDHRPAALLPLYASFVTLQALDVHSTHSALARGAVEANPAMQGLVGNSAGMIAVKAAGAAGVIFASEKIRTKNKAAAIGLMIATNSALAWVVQHNYRAAR